MKPLDPFTEYAKTACPRGSTCYYSLLFSDKQKKTALIALQAFQNELIKITEHYKEKNIAQIKLQWWQQEWQRMFEAKAQHPIAQVLQPFALTLSLPAVLFQEWVDGALLKLDVDHCCTESDLAFFCYREYGIKAILSAYLLGFEEPSSLKGVQALAYSIGLTHLLNHFGYHIKKGKCFFPLDWLTEHNLKETSLETESPSLKLLFQHVADLAEKQFNQGKNQIHPRDKSKLLPLIIESTITAKCRAEIIKADFPLLHHQIDLTPLRKLFIVMSCR